MYSLFSRPLSGLQHVATDTYRGPTCDLMEISPMAKKVNDYDTGIPLIEIEGLVSTLMPAMIAFFESEEGKRKFEEWKAAKEAEKAS